MITHELKQGYREVLEDVRRALSDFRTLRENIEEVIDSEGDHDEKLLHHLDFLNEQIVTLSGIITETSKQIIDLP